MECCTYSCGLDAERKAVKRSRQNYDPSDDEDEDEDEDDEFMGDFIDDGSDTERTDYSHYIRQLFGYDRRKSVLCCFDNNILTHWSYCFMFWNFGIGFFAFPDKLFFSFLWF